MSIISIYIKKYLSSLKSKPIITVLATLFAFAVVANILETDEDRTRKAAKHNADKHMENLDRQSQESQDKLKKQYGLEGIAIPGEK